MVDSIDKNKSAIPLPSDLGLTPTTKSKAWSEEAREAAAEARRGGGGAPPKVGERTLQLKEFARSHAHFISSLGGSRLKVEFNSTAKFSITRAKIPGHGKVSFKTEELKGNKKEFSVFVPGKYEGSSQNSMNEAWGHYMADRGGAWDE